MATIAILLVLFCLIGVLDAIASYYPAPAESSDPEIQTERIFLNNDRQRVITSFLTQIRHPVGYLHVKTTDPDNGCVGMVKTSTQAEKNGCKFAINAGPFNMDNGACEGSIISNGTVFQVDSTSGYSSFGLTADGRYVFGDVSDEEVTANKITELVSGFVGPLLVDHDTPCGAHADGDKVAQRQAIGIDKDGVLLILTVDGTEEPPHSMTIPELCDAFKSLGAVVALNLDGGGSTTTWQDGEFVNRPTCEDHFMPECERSVASTICVMAGH